MFSAKIQSTVSVSDKDNQMIMESNVSNETQHTIWRTQTMQAPDLNKTRGKGDFMSVVLIIFCYLCTEITFIPFGEILETLG